MKPVTKNQYLAAMDIVKRYRKQRGRIPTSQWLEENEGITVRLMHVLQSALSLPEYQFIDEITEDKFFKLKNAGLRSWKEFSEIREA